MNRAAAILLATAAGAGCLFDKTFLLVSGTIAPGYSDVFPITDGCVPRRDNLCELDQSVRIERATTDDPAIVSVAIESGSEIRVTGHAPGRAQVHVRFVDDGGDSREVSAVYRVAAGDQVTFRPICDPFIQRVGSEPFTYAGARDVRIVAEVRDQGEQVYGVGYRPWDAAPMTYMGDGGYGQSIFRTPAFAAAHVVTSPIDPALSVPFAFFPADDLTLEVIHQGNRAGSGNTWIEFDTQVKGGGTALCVDTFTRKMTIETPDTCYFGGDPVSSQTNYPNFRAYSNVTSGTCRVRVELVGTTVAQTIEVPVDLPPG